MTWSSNSKPTTLDTKEVIPKQHRRLATLGAMILFLATIEYMIPKPLPFLKLGIANLPILIGLTFLKPKDIITLIAMKIVGQGLIQGTLFSHLILFSFGGTLTSGLIMMTLYYIKIPHLSLVGISVIGALAGNSVQLLVAQLVLLGKDAWLMAPLFLGAGIISSSLLGIMANRFVAQSKWIERVRDYE